MAPTSSISGAALYEKKPGVLSISRDQRNLIWLPDSQKSSEIVNISIQDITNLQQTPPHVPKVMLKVFVKSSNAPEAVARTFHFKTGSNPREEANTIKDALSQLLSTAKANDPSVPRMNGSSAAMAMAGAAISKTSTDLYYDDAQLKSNIELQQSLMKKDPALHKTYMDARKTKPGDVSDSNFNSQFWSNKVGLLRSHAVELSQKRGSYHVLAAVKPRDVNGELKLNISGEQVQLIFNQHPLVKRVYDENVPKLKEAEFWSRFFLSRLFKKLKGERITLADGTDAIFDRYLDGNNELALGQSLLASHIPHIIDIEGNEENQGGAKGGNRQDFTMRQSSTSKVPIVRVLNSLSEKIMIHVKPSDVDPSAPIGMDEETFNALALRDLRNDAEEERIMLNIKEQSRFFSGDKDTTAGEGSHFTSRAPDQVLKEIQAEIDPASMDTGEPFNLRAAIDIREDSDSDEDDHQAHIGSRASRIRAQEQILAGISSRRSELLGSSDSNLAGLSQALYENLVLTHKTTTDFLHHFWKLFLSGDANEAEELARLVTTLDRSMDRINAVAADAELDRKQVIAKRKEHVREVWEASGKKLKFDPKSIEGGSKVVLEVMEPTIRALQKATKEYRRALAAEGIDTA